MAHYIVVRVCVGWLIAQFDLLQWKALCFCVCVSRKKKNTSPKLPSHRSWCWYVVVLLLFVVVARVCSLSLLFSLPLRFGNIFRPRGEFATTRILHARTEPHNVRKVNIVIYNILLPSACKEYILVQCDILTHFHGALVVFGVWRPHLAFFLVHTKIFDAYIAYITSFYTSHSFGVSAVPAPAIA